MLALYVFHSRRAESSITACNVGVAVIANYDKARGHAYLRFL